MPRISNVIVAAIVWLCVLTPTVVRGTPMQERKNLSRAEMEVLVKENLAERLKVPVDQIAVVDAADRTWDDDGLGCGARKGFSEPISIPGFAFTLVHSSARRTLYHTDRSGHLKRCDPRRSHSGRSGAEPECAASPPGGAA